MKKGFVVGKFMPLHKGHVYMLEVAQAYCDELTILVDHFEDEVIDVQTRRDIVERTFPSAHVTVKAMPQKMPQDPSQEANFWPVWISVLNDILDEDTSVVVGAMDYIKEIAARLEIDYLMVDKERTNFPISATDIRNHPYINWCYLAPESRPLYVKKIAVVGGESTGKTTLVHHLMRHYNTNWIPEYARTVVEEKEGHVEWSDFTKIVEGQKAINEVLTKQADKIVFHDTEFLTTKIWAERMFGRSIEGIDELIKDNGVDLYILLPHTVQWHEDITRLYPNEDDRQWFTNRFREELAKLKLPYVEIEAVEQNERMRQAIGAMRRHSDFNLPF